jgi:NAD(P)-dependent dehydrogenase (short-subunit alcohol dehydrogenase family)
MRLKDKVCVITGAASGIGRESAKLFAREGGSILVADLDKKGAETIAAEIERDGGTAEPCTVDVAKSSDVERMIATAEDRFGAVHVLFNNAGIFPDGDNTPVDTSEEVWDHVLNVNLKSVFLGCKFGIPALLRAGGGSIVNTASFVALMGSATSQVAYTASKGGVLAFSREVAAIYARQNIRCNAICPGPVDTPLLAALLADPAARQRRMVHIPPGRLARAEEIARAALFLASDDAAYVNGVAFPVDGGISATYVTPE